MYAPRTNKQWRTMCVLLMTLWWQSASTQVVAAHGIDRLLRAEGVKVGDMLLTVWTSPSRWRPGEVHVDVQTMRADGTLTTTAFVQVVIAPLGRAGMPQQTVAQLLAQPGTERNAATHEASFWVDDAGDYAVTVTVTDAQGNLGEVSIEEAKTPVPLTLTLALHTSLVGSLVAGAWLLRMGLRVWQPANVRAIQRV